MASEQPGWIGQANNGFAIGLYGKLADGDRKNLFFSPNSIETALTMTYAGARGQTAAQMAAVLCLPANSDTIHKDFGDFLDQLNGTGGNKGKARGYDLWAANALWGQTGYDFIPDFVSLLKTNYGAGIEEVNFKYDAEGARKTINAWVGKETREKITELISQGMLTPLTRLVLTNAIYFKGAWAAPFDKSATRDEPFHLSAGREKKTPLMHRTGSYGYMEGGDFQGLRLGYAGGDLSMIVMLPRQADGLPRLETELARGNLSDSFRNFRDQEVVVSLPRFRMTRGFDLAPVLQSMGMKDAFDGAADFSGMNGKKNIYISHVIHKAFIEVNEEGTEAAAATAVVIRETAVRPQPSPEFRADHPFLFLIREERSGAILFMGRLMEPD